MGLEGVNNVTDRHNTQATSRARVDKLKAGLRAYATGHDFEGGNDAYQRLRDELREYPDIYDRLPDFVRSCGALEEFWDFIRDPYPNYQARRRFLQESFAPVLVYLDEYENHLPMADVSAMLAELNSSTVNDVWSKALHRRRSDPDGAITAARTMLETVCKHILDDCGARYTKRDDLPKLWKLVAEQLNLTPEQHEAVDIKSILGGCQTVVGGIANLRNAVGDAHGQGRRSMRARPKHAALAVNLAGAMAAFLVASWQEQSPAEAQ